jgi:hypothetical protein
MSHRRYLRLMLETRGVASRWWWPTWYLELRFGRDVARDAVRIAKHARDWYDGGRLWTFGGAPLKPGDLVTLELDDKATPSRSAETVPFGRVVATAPPSPPGAPPPRQAGPEDVGPAESVPVFRDQKRDRTAL